MIGERLAEQRKEHGMTQQKLAKLLSVSVTTISGYENNHNSPCDETKVKIARLFNVSLDYLLGAINEELPLDRTNVIVLPKSFPEKARIEMNKHAELLGFKYKQLL